MKGDMDIAEVIKARKSCRTFRPVPLDPADRKILEEFIGNEKDLVGGEKKDLRIVEKGNSQRMMELNYGMIRGHNTYLLGVSRSVPEARVHYGYLMEKAVLRATGIGIATCWIGYFDDQYFDEIKTVKGFDIPSIVILGYPEEKQSRADRITRFAVSASKRIEWQKLFFDHKSGLPLNPEKSEGYAVPLEMVRLAPSAGNTQPWRVFFDDSGSFHFFKEPVSRRYEDRGLHDIDMGIALSHFELASLSCGLQGKWVRHPSGSMGHGDPLQYAVE
jgi:nitroreductase